MTLWKNHISRYGHFSGFWRFLWAKMAKIAPIDFKMGFPTNLKVNDGQTKFKINISKNVAKQWGFWPKMCPTATLARPSDGRNLVIFHPILTFFFLNCLFFRDESNGDKIKALSPLF